MAVEAHVVSYLDVTQCCFNGCGSPYEEHNELLASCQNVSGVQQCEQHLSFCIYVNT